MQIELSNSQRISRLGALGEQLAAEVLVRCGFANVKNLNNVRHNHEFGDLYAERDGRRYFIGVKARNEARSGGSRKNESYNLVLVPDRTNKQLKATGHSVAQITKIALARVHELASSYDATAAWMTIPVRATSGSFAAYFGTVDSLGLSRSVPMTAKSLANYECLTEWCYDDRIRSDLLN